MFNPPEKTDQNLEINNENGPYFFKQGQNILQEKNSFVKALEKMIHDHRVTHEQILQVKNNLHEQSDRLREKQRERQKKLYRILQTKSILKEEMKKKIMGISSIKSSSSLKMERIVENKRELLRLGEKEHQQQEKRMREQIFQAHMLSRERERN